MTSSFVIDHFKMKVVIMVTMVFDNIILMKEIKIDYSLVN